MKCRHKVFSTSILALVALSATTHSMAAENEMYVSIETQATPNVTSPAIAPGLSPNSDMSGNSMNQAGAPVTPPPSEGDSKSLSNVQINGGSDYDSGSSSSNGSMNGRSRASSGSSTSSGSVIEQ